MILLVLYETYCIRVYVSSYIQTVRLNKHEQSGSIVLYEEEDYYCKTWREVISTGMVLLLVENEHLWTGCVE